MSISEASLKVEAEENAAVEAGVDVPSLLGEVGENPQPVDSAGFRKAYDGLVRAQGLADRRQRTLEQRLEELQKRDQDLTARIDQVRRREKEVAAAELAVKEQREKLCAAEDKVAEKLREAEAGFTALREKRMSELEKEYDAYRKDWDQRRRTRLAALEQELAEQEKVAQARWSRTEERIEDRERQLDERFELLRRQEAELRQARVRSRAEAESVEQRLADERLIVENRVRRDLDSLRLQGEQWQARAEVAEEALQQRLAELRALRANLTELGDDPQAVVERNRRLRLENEQLRRANDELSPVDRVRLDEYVQRCADLEAERAELARRNAELERSAALNRISVAERETSRLVTQSLEKRNEVLTSQVESMRREYAELVQRQDGASAFPECSRMDLDEKLQTAPSLSQGAPRLRDLVHSVRHAIATQGLFFAEHDLRCFLGGLAATKLHLLQGISGIGKTSLPRAFSAAIGASCEVVSVAADWRSPQDLMGYYNPFERKYYESGFTQALYRAQLPLYADKPYLIVLDEMNLSVPEQYLSDVLSAMELTKRHSDDVQALELMTSRVDPAPRRLLDGRKLAIPANVWFIGTANQDETTFAPAAKTYDRAHVVELPSRPERFEPTDIQALRPFSVQGLNWRFDEARRHHGAAAAAVRTMLGELVGLHGEDLGVLVGSRTDRQIDSFVPVVIEAGGTAEEAADHLVATKVLRQLRGRIELRADQLKALHEDLEDLWTTIPDTRSGPRRSLALVEREIRNLAS
ncbi:AAA family ATPase [Amycolatopsis sp. NPDC003865]